MIESGRLLFTRESIVGAGKAAAAKLRTRGKHTYSWPGANKTRRQDMAEARGSSVNQANASSACPLDRPYVAD